MSFKFEQIVCIRRNEQPNDCRCITSVRTFSAQDYPVRDVIHLIEDVGYTFYVTDSNLNISLVNVVEREGSKYIRTAPDDTPDDNLLKLPNCDDLIRY